MGDKEKYITVQEVCEWLRIKESQVYQLLKRKDLEGNKIGKYWRIKEKSVSDYLERTSNMNIIG